MKARELVKEMTGMTNPKVTTVKDAIGLLKKFEAVGFKLTRKDGTPFDFRFFRNRPDFIDMANEVIDIFMDTEVRPHSSDSGREGERNE